MHRFYADEAPTGELAPLSPEDVRHAQRVLRMQPGDAMELLFDGRRFAGVLAGMPNGELGCRITDELPTTEPALQITLYQGLPKAEKMDWIVQKAVELGASRVVPVSMRRCVVQLDARDGTRKQERWQKIAREAAKQSGRCQLMEVEAPITMNALASRLAAHEAALVPWEEAAGYSLNAFHTERPACKDVAVVIGPEGGIAPEEIVQMNKAGCRAVTLGKRILRTETAAMASIAALMCLYGEME